MNIHSNTETIVDDKINTILFIHKNVSFIEKSLYRIVNSIKKGELIVYNYVKAMRYSDIYKLTSKIKTTIHNRGEISSENDIFADMLKVKLKYLGDKNIEKLLRKTTTSI